MLVIENEEQAWDALRRALDGDLTLEQAAVVDFRGWPTIRVHLPETPVMAAVSMLLNSRVH